MYRGVDKIMDNIKCMVKLPDYCIAWYNFTINLTSHTRNNLIYATRVKDNTFTVFGKNGSFSWVVFATKNTIDVEPNKTDYNVNGVGPYTYLSNK
jgi:hypothetical protein